MKEYVIVGDTDKYNDCLVCLAGTTLEHAKERLNQMLTEPDDNDKFLMNGHRNFRIQEVESEKCWWNDPSLAN